jgi:hypothetical protein
VLSRRSREVLEADVERDGGHRDRAGRQALRRGAQAGAQLI